VPTTSSSSSSCDTHTCRISNSAAGQSAAVAVPWHSPYNIRLHARGTQLDMAQHTGMTYTVLPASKPPAPSICILQAVSHVVCIVIAPLHRF
jgi:hypothetical protein